LEESGEGMVFSPTDLVSANGVDSELIYVAVQGKVYDVGERDDLYGPGGNYHVFAGKDCTRAFALMSTDSAECNRQDVDDLNATHRTTLRQWIKMFGDKYIVVGEYSPADACIVDLSKDDEAQETDIPFPKESEIPEQRFSFRKWAKSWFQGSEEVAAAA
jgi:membrane-associated progesterone receptor component